jgi:beta-lactamase class A
VRSRNPIPVLRLFSLSLIFAAVVVLVLQLVSYSRLRSSFPSGMIIAEVPVGGLNQRRAADRLTQVYRIPIELHYEDAVIQVKPAIAGFELDLEAMMAVADLQRVSQPFWTEFWSFLWNRLPTPGEVPIRATISEERLRQYLTNEIAARYDRPPEVAMPTTGGANFEPGQPGSELNIDRAVLLIADALYSPTDRTVRLTTNQIAPQRPSSENLQVMLQRVLEVSNFDGLAEIFLMDLQNRQELHFALDNGQYIDPEIAFTAASTIKIPIMVSTFLREDEPGRQSITNLLEEMIEQSENGPADALMKDIGDNLGPLRVSDDMNILGLQNTFLAGYFYIGAPLLVRYETPANLRTDVNLFPDPYNQTTTVDMGMLLDDIYQCAETGGGSLVAVFPGEITQNECRLMITYLERNDLPMLVQAGLPEGTKLAHKHGWITENDGLIHSMGDVGIVYTPGGNYVLCIFLYHPVQLVFDPANELVARLSSIIYSYYNLTTR